MKKLFVIMAAFMLSAGVANAQSLGSILGQVAQSATKDNSTLSALTNIISSKLIPSSDQIVGTWRYQKPAVMFVSSNVLKSTAASVASSTIETKLQTKLNAVGVKPGKMSITYNADKTFTVERNGKKVASGTYTVSSNDITMTFKGRKTPCKVTPQLDNGTLVIVTDVSKLQNLITSLGSNISQLSTVTSLLKSYDGAKVGIRMSK